MWINNFDWLIVVDAQPEFFPKHPLVNNVIQNIKKNIYLAMESKLPIFFITKRENINDWEWVIIWDDSEIIIESIENMVLKSWYDKVYYLSKEGTPLLEKKANWKILDLSDLEKVKDIFEWINTPLISGCFTLACEFAVARDLIINNIANPKIHFSSSHDWEWSWNKEYIKKEFEKYWYDWLLIDEEFDLNLS